MDFRNHCMSNLYIVFYLQDIVFHSFPYESQYEGTWNMFILVIQHNEHSESKESKEASKSIRKQPESQNSKDGLSPWKRAEKSNKTKKQKEKLECLKQGTKTNWQTMRGTRMYTREGRLMGDRWN